MAIRRDRLALSGHRPDSPIRDDRAIATAEWIKAALGASVAFCDRWTAGDPIDLLPAEAALTGRAVPGRVEEFARGRSCAHRALALLGGGGPVLVGPGRAPHWPAGFVGSITHTRGYCAALAGRSGRWAGLGIDAEILKDVGDEIEDQILRPSEQMTLRALPPSRRQSVRAAIFSAKEAYFKCQFPITKLWLDFKDVTISLADGAFEVQPERDLAQLAKWPRPAGSYGVFGDLVITAIGFASSEPSP